MDQGEPRLNTDQVQPERQGDMEALRHSAQRILGEVQGEILIGLENLLVFIISFAGET